MNIAFTDMASLLPYHLEDNSMSIIKSARYKIRTCSPVHIKGKDIDYGEGFVRRNQSTAWALDADKLGELLFRETGDLTLVKEYADLLEKYAAQNKLKEFNIELFLSKKGIYHHKDNRSREKELIESGVFKNIVNATETTHFIKNGYGQPFIPGSAIKGMLRTAVMYHIIKEALEKGNDNYITIFFRDFNKNITGLANQMKKDKRRANKLKTEFSKTLQNFTFQNGKTGMDPARDFFRAVKVKDTPPLSKASMKFKKITLTSLIQVDEKQKEDDTFSDSDERIGVIRALGEGGVYVEYKDQSFDFTNQVYNKKISMLKKNLNKKIKILELGGKRIKKFEILDETVAEKTADDQKVKDNYSLAKKERYGEVIDFDTEVFNGVSEFQISIDYSILNNMRDAGYDLPFSDLNALMELVRAFGDKVWQEESEFFNENQDDILDCKALREFYARMPERAFSRIGWGTGINGLTVDLLLKESQRQLLRNKLFHDRGETPAPKSRRLLFEEDLPRYPLGWVEFEKIEEIE
ncbi:type III-A CRISPR-associated RAMP protein Csm5 [candidate division KSB1 bacterium]|nr:type III-A CRISPR-associated RAMP protein Csm5 [candidate division KSB1 bacterium]